MDRTVDIDFCKPSASDRDMVLAFQLKASSVDTLSLQTGNTTTAILLAVAMVGAVLLAKALISRKWKAIAVSAAGTSAMFVWFKLANEIPNEIVVFLPHLSTLLVLTFASQRLRPPAADGVRYRRGRTG